MSPLTQRPNYRNHSNKIQISNSFTKHGMGYKSKMLKNFARHVREKVNENQSPTNNRIITKEKTKY